MDASNPIADAPPANGELKYFTSLDDSLMERLQSAYPNTHFVKCFSSVGNTSAFSFGSLTILRVDVDRENDRARNTLNESRIQCHILKSRLPSSTPSAAMINTQFRKRLSLLALLLFACPLSLPAQNAAPVAAINSVLNELHNAASKADGSTYFKLFTNDAVYIGTDAGERWTIKQFRAFAEPYFAKGTGWTYKPRSRHVVIANNPCSCIAWFDELLDSEKYGTSRGTGVLTLNNGSWKIAQYALTFPIPNDLAAGMTAEIKTFEAKAKR